MNQTLVEKIISRKVGRNVVAGEILSVGVDSLLINDYVGALIFSKLEEMGCLKICNPERVFIAVDHNIPAFSVDAADKLVLFRERAKQYGITRMTVPGRHGIGHQMMVQNYVKPLEIAVGTDSHASMYGGVSAFGCGITTSDAISIMLTSEMWIRVPDTIRIRLVGRLQSGVAAKDLALTIVNLLPEEEYAYNAVEFIGEGVESLSVESRLVLANMIAECGAKCALFEADEKAYAYTGMQPGDCLKSDEEAYFLKSLEIDLEQLGPKIACPDTVFNVHSVMEVEQVRVDQVFLGSCTNGRLEDMLQAAEILRGRKVAEGTRLLVTPATQQIALQMTEQGITEVFLKAGAVILPSSCASCAGHGPGLIGRGEVCMSTTNRNFKGRMGSLDGKVYLGSAYSAAAAAVAGSIVDPRIYLGGGNLE